MMCSKRGLLIIALLCAAAGTAGTLAGRWASPQPTPAPMDQVIDGLAIDPAALDFGEVWGGPDFALHLTVRNVTHRDIHVTEFSTGCDCRPVEPKTLTIPAGESREIRVTLDVEKQSPALVGQTRRVETELRPVVAGKPAAKAWTIRGTVRPLIATDLPAVLFGNSNRAGQPPVPRQVRVRFYEAGAARAELVPPVAAVAVRPAAGPTEWTVVVTPFTDQRPGPFRGTLTITNLSPDGRPLACLNLPVEGFLAEGNP